LSEEARTTLNQHQHTGYFEHHSTVISNWT